jgi:hypothetical protein
MSQICCREAPRLCLPALHGCAAGKPLIKNGIGLSSERMASDGGCTQVIDSQHVLFQFRRVSGEQEVQDLAQQRLG